MSYVPFVWVEKASKVGPTNLNHLENGLQAAAAVADAAQTAAAAAQATATAAFPTPAGSNGQFLKKVGGVWVPTTFAVTDIPTASIDQTYMAAGNKVTTGLLSAGPPGAPTTGDVWIATAVDTGNLATTNGTRWAFQYNGASGSAFKWEFIGGSPGVVRTAGGTSFAASISYQNPSGIAFTAARAGDYLARISARLHNSSAGNVDFNYNVAAGAVSPTEASSLIVVASDFATASREDRLLAVAAATAIQPRYAPQTATAAISADFEVLTVVPIRIA